MVKIDFFVDNVLNKCKKVFIVFIVEKYTINTNQTAENGWFVKIKNVMLRHILVVFKMNQILLIKKKCYKIISIIFAKIVN